ncbi:MAG: hypothetical protein LBG06_02930 [Deltaproteobacteria bacterium]|jgi:hypothetical protein|nr:hypothetical protein [Deltaproteobacteria bacterium]
MSAYFTEMRIDILPGLHTLDHPSMKGQKADYENSVYGIPRQSVHPLIPGLSMPVSRGYREWNGRHPKDNNTLIVLDILQEMDGWTMKQAPLALKGDAPVKYPRGCRTARLTTLSGSAI